MLLKIEVLKYYALLFYDSGLANCLFSVQNAYVAKAMQTFNYNENWIIIISSLGFMAGAILNYALGLFIQMLPFLNREIALHKKRVMLVNCNENTIFIMIALMFDPFNKIMSLLLGFLRYDFKSFLRLTLITKTIHSLVFGFI